MAEQALNDVLRVVEFAGSLRRGSFNRALLEAARQLAPGRMTISSIEIADWDDSTSGEPVAIVDVECSAGTYVRSLARDLGTAVGSAAYLGALTRTASGPFVLDDAVPLDRVRAAAEEGPEALAALLRPIDAGLDELPTVAVPDPAVSGLGRGQSIGVPPGSGRIETGTPVRLVDSGGRLVAIARLEGTKLAPDKVLIDPPAAGPA